MTPDDISDKLTDALESAAVRLRQQGVTGQLAAEMEQLAKEVREPCVIAVVGEVKVGKSTFVNAFLGEDRAITGTNETTATINHFSYGTPPDPNRPVRVHWRGGQQPTDTERAFLDDLQGNDEETLKKASDIEYLEYFLPNSHLKRITLVDTPGTGAVVKEHQERSEEFALRKDLRNRHHEETQKIRNTADAVIYLVRPVAKADDKEFLKGFQAATGNQSSALNAVGVLSMIELYPALLDAEYSSKLAQRISSQLEGGLNTVIPVGAGVRRALDDLLEDDQAGLRHLTAMLRRIPPDTLDWLLETAEIFKVDEDPDSPVSPEERKELVGEMPWVVFRTVAAVAADPKLDTEAVVAKLDEISNFDRLRKVIDERFVSRGHILRCYRIANDALGLVEDEIEYRLLRRYRKQADRDRERFEGYLAFIRRADGDPDTAQELEELVRQHADPDERIRALEALRADLSIRLDGLLSRLKGLNADFDALQQVEADSAQFNDNELDELRALFGMYGTRVEDRLRLGDGAGTAAKAAVGARQIYWKVRQDRARVGTARRAVAAWAESRYGLILGQLSERGSTRTGAGANTAWGM